MRKPRVYPQGIYYITVRGNSHESLFNGPADYEYFLNIINFRKEKYNFKIYAQSLMPRFYQLLIEPGEGANISKIMQALNTSYALYYNKKYHHLGHIVAGRFESHIVNDANSLTEIIRRLKSIGYIPQAERNYLLVARRHLSLFKRYYLVPAAMLIFLFIGLQVKMGTVQKIEPSPFFVALPDGLPQATVFAPQIKGAIDVPVR